MADSPFDIAVYTPDLARPGWIGAPLWVTATPRHNAQPTAAFALPADDERVPLLGAEGSRVVMRYRDEHLVGGPVRLRSSTGTGATGVCTYQVADDWRLLSRLLLWQVPGAPIGGQSAAEHHTVTGPAETVAKTLLGAAITRLGLPVAVAPDLGRGQVITVQARMNLPVDVLLPLVDQAGIGLTVRQGPSGLVLDAYEPVTWPLDLSEDGGTLTEASWSLQPPEVTRVVVGIGGEGTARQYFEFVDHALEATWGDVVERFVDARDIALDDPDKATLAAARGAEALAAGAATAGLSVQLAETSVFRYGRPGVLVGDRVNVSLGAGQAMSDVLREAPLSWGADGLDVVPVVGERRDDPQVATIRAVAALGRQSRINQARS